MGAADDYFITTSVGPRTRRFIWRPKDVVALDHPGRWFLKHTNRGILLRDRSAPRSHPQRSIRIAYKQIRANEASVVDLPPAFGGSEAPVRLTFRRLKHIPAPYEAPVTTSGLGLDGKSSQIYVYWGIKNSLTDYDRGASTFRAKVEDKTVFVMRRRPSGVEIAAVKDDLTLECPDSRQVFTAGVPVALSYAQVASARLTWGDHWWRLVRVPVPPAIPAEALREEENQERKAVFKLNATVLAVATVLLALVVFWPHTPPLKVKIETTISLKQPKVIAKKLDLPKPVVVKPPVEVVKKPTPPRTHAFPKKTPKTPPNLVKSEPKSAPKAPPKPASAPSHPKPATAPQPKIAQSPKTSGKPPAPAAPSTQQKEAAQVAASLAFLSATPSGPSGGGAAKAGKSGAPAVNYDNLAKAGGAASAAGPGLSGLVEGAPSSGPIATKGAATAGGDLKIGGGGKGKGLNSVQGKVAAGDLAGTGGGKGGALVAAGGSLSVAGPGKINESELNKTLRRHMHRFQYCYEKALLAKPSLAGQVTVGWTIDGSGRAQGAKVVASQLNDAGLHSCLTGIIAGITFPTAQGGAVGVKYPFNFQSTAL